MFADGPLSLAATTLGNKKKNRSLVRTIGRSGKTNARLASSCDAKERERTGQPGGGPASHRKGEADSQLPIRRKRTVARGNAIPGNRAGKVPICYYSHSVKRGKRPAWMELKKVGRTSAPLKGSYGKDALPLAEPGSLRR